MERTLSNQDIKEMSKTYDSKENWDGIERRKGYSSVSPEFERRKNKWIKRGK